MQRIIRISFVSFACYLLICIASALAYVSPGTPQGYVSDYGRMLSDQTEGLIETKLNEFELQTGVEIAVVTVGSLGSDETIETYAVKLFEDYGIGKEKEDNGLLLLIARDEREMRIEVGYGLEPVMTDIESAAIIRGIIVPEFQAGNYDAGVQRAIEQIIISLQTEWVPESTENPAFLSIYWPIILFFGFFVLVFAFNVASGLGHSKSWWQGGVAGAVVGGFMGRNIGWVILLGIVGLLADYLASRSYAKRKKDGKTPPWWFGGGGHRGGGGGGFGGFGGGMSGGGGASGRW